MNFPIIVPQQKIFPIIVPQQKIVTVHGDERKKRETTDQHGGVGGIPLGCAKVGIS